MRPLKQALHDHELIVLRVIGEWWELDLTGADKAACVSALSDTLGRLDMVQEKQFLPPEEAAALDTLLASGGRMPVPAFTRAHGEVRMMGPGKLEREEPWFDPASPAEALWYRGFLFRAFDETAEGVIEFYFLPDEIVAQFPQPEAPPEETETTVSTLPAVPPPSTPPQPTTAAVDDLTALLALAQQTSLKLDNQAWLDALLLNPDPERRSLLVNLAREMGMVRRTNGGIRPTRTAVSWLQQSREQQLRALADAWSSCSWNDLCHTPGLRCEGDNWQNDPILARTALLDALPRSSDWFSLDDLITQMKETNPDFQRPDGNYDTWYVRDVASNEYVTGFDNWDRVEGRLLAFLVQGPLVWLGLAVVAAPAPDAPILFQLTDRALEWLDDTPAPEQEVRVPIVVEADATLIVPHNADRYHRFQAARISEPAPVTPGQPFHYRLTPQSMQRAQEQNISPDRILQFLEAASGRPLPASVKRSLSRWGERGVEGRLETAVILRVREAGILETLRNNPKTRDYIGESLGELSATVRLDQWEALRAAVAELGLLLDADIAAGSS